MTNYAEWEDRVTYFVEVGTDASRSDAQSIMEVQDATVRNAWIQKLDAETAAKAVIGASEVLR